MKPLSSSIQAALVVLASLATCSTAFAQQGDAQRGKALYTNQCMACHAADISLAGPMHRGVFGRQSGAVPDYAYSPALLKLKVKWTQRNLDQWLRDPNRMAPGNRMGYSVADAQQRLDIIAYLQTLKAQ